MFGSPQGLIGTTHRTAIGPLAIENAAGRSAAPARTPFAPGTDLNWPPGSSAREGLKRLLYCTIQTMVLPYIVWWLSSSSQWTLL